MAKQPGFFDADERLKALSAAGDPLERLRAVVDFEVFRADSRRRSTMAIAAVVAVRHTTRC